MEKRTWEKQTKFGDIDGRHEAKLRDHCPDNWGNRARSPLHRNFNFRLTAPVASRNEIQPGHLVQIVFRTEPMLANVTSHAPEILP